MEHCGNKQLRLFFVSFLSPGANRGNYSNPKLDALPEDDDETPGYEPPTRGLRRSTADPGSRSACHPLLVPEHGGGTQLLAH